jgi:hypothetical protein
VRGDDQARDVAGQQRVAIDRRLDAQHIGGRAAQMAAAQGVGQRLFVDQAAAGGIDHQAPGLSSASSRAPIMCGCAR